MDIHSLIKKFYKLNTSQIITLGFAGVIFVGGLILWLPFCTVPGETTSFTDAMFTSTTCICVTGLVTVVTATHWTIIGKVVILILIQIGGIGVIALTNLIFLSLHKKISMRNRRMIQESYNLDQMSGLVKVVRRVVFCVFGAEAVGAICYSFCFVPQFGLAEGIAQSVFTAVSAFCNAGVDILGETSLAPYVDNPLVNFTTMGLIISAGLGFTVWWDIWDKIKKVVKKEISYKRMFKTLRLHSKLAITMTLVLILGGTFLIYLFEYKNSATLRGKSIGEGLMAAAFQSVTTRTAGFFTIDQTAFGNASIVLCLVLMFIGGSPSSTAGGIKTTTFAVLLLNAFATFRSQEDVCAFGRRFDCQAIKNAATITMMYFILFFTGGIAISIYEGLPLSSCLYEAVSAVCTVGLTLGITPKLHILSRFILILLMYLGRVGGLTLIYAILSNKNRNNAKMPLEKITIG